MEHPGFFERAGPFRLEEILEAANESGVSVDDLDQTIQDIKPLDQATDRDLSFLDNPKYVSEFERTTAAACFVAQKYAEKTPSNTTAIVVQDPYRSFAQALQLFYPDAMRSKTAHAMDWPKGEHIHPSAQLEAGVEIEPGATIGPEACIGRDTRIAAGAVIGYRVHIGRGCYVGPNVSITNTLIGDHVIIHAGAGIGQDGLGFAMGPGGHLKVPQIGRVILQDHVEVGANSTIDRGALRDTIVGEGTKIDNLVQIGHNVVIGRHCVLAGLTGISGSTEIGDFVLFGGQSGVVGHVKIASGTQVGAKSAVMGDVLERQRLAGIPARTAKRWARELTILKRLAIESHTAHKKDKTSGRGDDR